MTTPQYNWNPSKEQIEAGIRQLGEIKMQAELRTALQRHPWAARYLGSHRPLNPFALGVLLDQSVSCEEWARML